MTYGFWASRPWMMFGPILACLLVWSASTASCAPREIKVSNDTAGEVTVLAPAEEPKLFVVFISDYDGLTAARRAEAEKFVSRGAAVALIDLPDFIKKTNESDDADCHYPFGDFEDIARVAERELKMAQWRWPIMVGVGDGGGTLAYLSTAQAPENTARGGISLGMQKTFKTRLTICGVRESHNDNGLRTYEASGWLHGHWTLITHDQPTPEIAPFTTAAPTAKLALLPPSASLIDAAVDEAFSISGAPAELLANLPLVEIPAKGKILGLAIFISGDGGWRDIDKQIAEYLSDHGIAIVGIDSLRYFWTQKDPQQIATDVAKVVKHYTKLWQVNKANLMGYSLGANAIPFIWEKFDPAMQNTIQVMVMLGLEPTTQFEVTVQGWLGITGSTEMDVRPHLVNLPTSKVMCFYGAEEKDENDTACTFPELANAQIIERPGGHHFDYNYKAVADIILQRLIGKA